MNLRRLMLKYHAYWLPYVVICLVFSIPLIQGVYNLVYSNSMASGLDNPVHAYFIKRMIETGDPLISYTQFPLLNHQIEMYYPSFMHILIALPLAAFNLTDSMMVIGALNFFIILVSIIGSLGFSLLVKELLKLAFFKTHKINVFHFGLKYFIYFNFLCILAFTFVILSTPLLLKTINDGTYAEVFAMWAILPFYLVFLLRQNWVKSGILLALIAAVHNLSFIMTFTITVAYLLSLLMNSDLKTLRKSARLFITFGILALPVILIFYVPTINGFLGQATGQLSLVSKETVLAYLSPFQFYGIVVASVVLLIIGYRTLSWLSLWGLFYYILIYSFPVISSRVLRESSVAFSLIIGITIAYGIHFILYSDVFRRIKNSNISLFRNNLFRVIVVGVIITIVIPLFFSYQYERFSFESNTLITLYHSKAFSDSHDYLNAVYEKFHGNGTGTGINSNDKKQTIAVYGYDPWLKIVLYDQFDVVDVMPKDIGDTLSVTDRQINNELSSIIYQPSNVLAGCYLNKYNIDYVYIPDVLSNRYDSEYQYNVFYKMLHLFNSVYSPFVLYPLEKFQGDNGELLQIYGVNKKYLDAIC